MTFLEAYFTFKPARRKQCPKHGGQSHSLHEDTCWIDLQEAYQDLIDRFNASEQLEKYKNNPPILNQNSLLYNDWEVK